VTVRGAARTTVVGVPLLSGMIRNVAITGSSDVVSRRIAGRQGSDWAERTVHAAFPAQMAHGYQRAANPMRNLDALTELHRNGAVTDAEYEALRQRLGV
jgi:hypothetical protein